MLHIQCLVKFHQQTAHQYVFIFVQYKNPKHKMAKQHERTPRVSFQEHIALSSLKYFATVFRERTNRTSQLSDELVIMHLSMRVLMQKIWHVN